MKAQTFYKNLFHFFIQKNFFTPKNGRRKRCLLFIVVLGIVPIMAPPSEADDHFLIDLVGEGRSSLHRIIPSDGPIYIRDCQVRVDGMDLTSSDRLSMRSATLFCEGHRVNEPSVKFKKTNGNLYLIDEEGYISSTSDGTYSSTGELHFSFHRSLTYNLNETHIRNCQLKVVPKSDTLNSYTEYELVKNNGDQFKMIRNSTYEVFELRKFQVPDCPGVTGEYFEKQTYSHQFRGNLRQID